MSFTNTINVTSSPDFSSYAAAYAALEQCLARMSRAGPRDLEEMERIIRDAGRAVAFCRTRIEEIRSVCSQNLAELP